MSNLDSVNIEERTVNVAVFNQTDAALAELKVRFATIPDCATKEGYVEAKAGKKELTKYRSRLETARKEIKNPYKVAGEIIDAEAKRIRLELEAIESPIKAAIKVADEAEAVKKAARIARLQAKVDEIYNIETKAMAEEGKDVVSDYIELLNNLDVDNDYYDLTTQAQDAKALVLDRLGNLYAQRLGMEVAEMQRLEAEERSKAAEAEAKMLRETLAQERAAEKERVAIEQQRAAEQEATGQEQTHRPPVEEAQETTSDIQSPPETLPAHQEFTPTDEIESITISLVEYTELYNAKRLLDALKAAGVTQWGGYKAAIQILESGASTLDKAP